jgi:hypothetical protein
MLFYWEISTFGNGAHFTSGEGMAISARLEFFAARCDKPTEKTNKKNLPPLKCKTPPHDVACFTGDAEITATQQKCHPISA